MAAWRKCFPGRRPAALARSGPRADSSTRTGRSSPAAPRKRCRSCRAARTGACAETRQSSCRTAFRQDSPARRSPPSSSRRFPARNRAEFAPADRSSLAARQGSDGRRLWLCDRRHRRWCAYGSRRSDRRCGSRGRQPSSAAEAASSESWAARRPAATACRWRRRRGPSSRECGCGPCRRGRSAPLRPASSGRLR